MNTTDKPHYLGHRKRVKEKFLKSDPKSFLDYELLEILLFSTHPRKDTKIIAKNIINDFENIDNLLDQDLNYLLENENINENSLILIKIIKEIIHRKFLQRISEKPIFDDWNCALNYCKLQLSNLKNEEFRILFLDKKHQLIEDYRHNDGLNDQVEIDISKIVKKAALLSINATILYHNHPTGELKPSKNDIITTQKIKKALETINVKTYDHLIIGNSKDEYYSFKEHGLL